MSASRVVVLGFDAMDVGIARSMAADGRMPAFAELLETAAWAEMRTPPGLVVGGIWPTLTTGTWPSRHGFYCDRQISTGSYEAPRRGPADIDVPRIWDVLSRAGRRCAVLDVPLTTPAADLNGIQLVEWGAHDRFLDMCTSPADLAAEILDSFGEHPVQPKCDSYARNDDLVGLLRAIRRGIEAKERLASYAIDKEDWDLLWLVFGESHCAGHQMWSTHDPGHPRHDAALRAAIGDPLLEVYEALDAALGRVLLQIPEQTTLVVLLSHGFGPHYDGDHLLSEILLRLDIAEDGPRRWRTSRERVRRRLERRGRRSRDAIPLVSERRFFKVPNNELYGGIRVNLKGREPRGRIAPGAAYDAVLDTLQNDLLALMNPDTGGPLVRGVFRADDVYDRPTRDALPDLFVDWHRAAPITGAQSPKIGTIRGEPLAMRTGDHRPTGFLMVRGPGRIPGPFASEVAAVDVAPTIAALLNVELAGVDGLALDSLVL